MHAIGEVGGVQIEVPTGPGEVPLSAQLIDPVLA
jgi:hypothetical protein